MKVLSALAAAESSIPFSSGTPTDLDLDFAEFTVLDGATEMSHDSSTSGATRARIRAELLSSPNSPELTTALRTDSMTLLSGESWCSAPRGNNSSIVS
jgi:hypothetical protein